MQEMLFKEKGINWNDFPVGQKRGRAIMPVEVEVEIEVLGETKTVTRTVWKTIEPPIFSKDSFLDDAIMKTPE